MRGFIGRGLKIIVTDDAIIAERKGKNPIFIRVSVHVGALPLTSNRINKTLCFQSPIILRQIAHFQLKALFW